MADDTLSDHEELSKLHARLADMDDSLARLLSLCHLGNLAAEGMHELAGNTDSIAFTHYFTLFRDELNTLQQAFIGERNSE